jgi:HPt (histidine-containing phosphotransfer) domain-containing protein
MSALRVLLIGGETAESEHIFSLLEEAHHAVLPVPNFDEASEALLIQKFDAVLITPALSAGGVDDFTAHLRQTEKNQRNCVRTPVLSLVQGGSPSTAGTNRSVDAYLPERFEPAAFAQTVEKLANAVGQSNEESEGSASALELPIFDVTEFKAQVANDRELMVEIIDLFLEERDQDLTQMTESLATGDLDKLMRGAHTIKGSLASLHASLARHRSQELETAARTGNKQACISLLGALEEDLNELEPQLLSLRSSAKR